MYVPVVCDGSTTFRSSDLNRTSVKPGRRTCRELIKPKKKDPHAWLTVVKPDEGAARFKLGQSQKTFIRLY